MVEDGQQPFNEQEPLPRRERADRAAEGVSQAWPPPPRERVSQGPSRGVKVVTTLLALILIAGGVGFIIFAANSQYSEALKAARSFRVSATARGIANARATVTQVRRETAIPLETAQAQIVASATAQALPTVTIQAENNNASATATIQNNALAQATTGTPQLDDPLADNSLNNRWDVGYSNNSGTGCNFSNSAYKVQEAVLGMLQPCFADTTNYSNFAYQVTMAMETQGEGGLIFRGNKTQGRYYLFTIDSNSNYAFAVYNGSQGVILTRGKNAAIMGGIGASNTLAILAQGGSLALFVNQTYIDGVNDTALSAGQVGVAAVDASLPTTINFSDARVWKR